MESQCSYWKIAARSRVDSSPVEGSLPTGPALNCAARIGKASRRAARPFGQCGGFSPVEEPRTARPALKCARVDREDAGKAGER